MIKRRTFLKQGSMVAMLASLAPKVLLAKPKGYKFGYQLFSVRDFMDKKPEQTLKDLSAMGYEDFETYGLDTEKIGYYGMKSTNFRRLLNDNGLSTSSGHYNLADFIDTPKAMQVYVEKSIQGAIDLGQEYITWPWLPPEQRNLQNYERMPDILNKVGEQISEADAGLCLAYHNHGWDLQDLGNGKVGYEIIRKETDPNLVKLQLDMYWAVHAGFDPAELISREPQRYVMWHLKDMDKITRDYSEMGKGSIDYVDILSRTSQTGLKYFYVEQGGNYAVDSMTSAQTSASYVRNNLDQFLFR